MNYDLEITIKRMALLECLGKESPAVALSVDNTVKEIIMLAKAQGREEAIKEMSERTYTQFPAMNYPTRANAIADQFGNDYSAMMLNDENEFKV